MMTPEQIAAMRADADAGTKGPWGTESGLPYNEMPRVHSDEGFLICEVGNIASGQDEWEANARRIARVPDMEATIIAQAAEIERLKAAGAEWMDARKGSVSPDAVRATFDRLAEAESALVAAFDGARPSAKPGIPWRDGPPPAEWRDGREVLVWAKNAHHGFWRAGSWHVVNGSGAQIVQSMITHHAAIDKPGETL